MTEKRYYAHKYSLQENKIHDKICHNFMNIDETVEHMNNQYWKYKQLKEENEQLKTQLQNTSDQRNEFHRAMRENANRVGKLKKENEQLKHNNKMLSMKMSEVSTKYRLLKEFSDDTNPNEAVKTVLHELMMITKEYR